MKNYKLQRCGSVEECWEHLGQIKKSNEDTLKETNLVGWLVNCGSFEDLSFNSLEIR